MANVNILQSTNIDGVQVKDFADQAAYNTATSTELPADGNNKILVIIGGALYTLDDNGDLTAVGGSGGDLTAIAEVDLASDTASISFTSIPGTYAHLMLIGQLRSDRASENRDGLSIVFNADTTAAHYAHMYNIVSTGGGGTATGTIDDSAPGIEPDDYILPAADSPSGYFSAIDLVIPAYADTDTYRHLRGNFSSHSSATPGGFAGNFSGVWKNAADAITQIDLAPVAGSNFVAGSRLTLYGIAGS